MAISAPAKPRDRRFQLRATAQEETLIKVAAERKGLNVTEFILSAACEKAEEALVDQTRFMLDDGQWKGVYGGTRPARSAETPSPEVIF